MATYKRRKFLNQGKRADPAPENKHTAPAPIRARAPLIEQFYVGRSTIEVGIWNI
jgi:hypothetical protein